MPIKRPIGTDKITVANVSHEYANRKVINRNKRIDKNINEL